MLMAEKIHQSVQRLPVRLQAEVLDFVEYLLTKQRQPLAQKEEADWSEVSLAFALRDMSDEEETTYSIEELKVLF